ncbi:MAG TPA: hypothetical protein P5307_13135 [Pirellulaceae bacterium]|nr:hypothetical protein [Planctomycetales bacterium]MCB9938064.1 hypothetical protein [Planctomycetaceae bacterium]HRX80006.1 hypothetical protein [Pirellulaceae bacterium]
MLEREEYVEQAYFFRTLGERLPKNMPLQELLRQTREELLASTNLPHAIDFLRTELEHAGVFGTAMARLPHYFTPFQTYVIQEAENERGRFDMRIALEILRSEAEYRTKGASPQGLFLFHFETLSRNRLRYDKGLAAVAGDPLYDDAWRDWIMFVRHQVGFIDLADLLYMRSEYSNIRRKAQRGVVAEPEKPVLFGEKEGKIAFANRGKEPLYLFAALQRHLGYPAVPRPKPQDDSVDVLPLVLRRLERIEARLKIMEEEQRGGLDITKFYGEQPKFLPPPLAE